MKKKVLAVILGAVMVASMAGCGGSDTKTTDAAATETTDSTDVQKAQKQQKLQTEKAILSVFPSSQSTVPWITVVRDFWKV